MESHSLECLDFARVRDLLASFAMSALGRALACGIRPAVKPGIIQRWLDQVREMSRAADTLGLPPFGEISDVREPVKKSAPPLRLRVDEVAQIGRTLAGTHAVAEYLARLPDDMPELRSLAQRVGDFRSIAERIARVIDERGVVRSEASDKLARIRARIEEAGVGIRDVMQRLLRQPGVLRLLQYNNYTFHDDRLVLPVKAEHRGRLPGITHRASDSGATVYIEPAEVVELNNEIARLRADEDEEIGRLLWELVHEVHINQESILRTLDTLAVLDLVVAKVRFARAFNMTCPALNDQGRMNLRHARHPLLLELARQKQLAGEAPSEIVPAGVRLGEDFDMLVITGPNTGGKTVLLKSVGLICLMAQAGLPVPVEDGSEICVFQNIMIDVGDEQSMQQSLSTFSAHMKRVMEMLQKANERTLLLIDELGAGTDPDEGAAIGRAVLDELRRRRSRCIVTTHLGALKAYAFVRERVENASVEFDVRTLRPTYRLRIGEPGASNAIDIAEQLGLPRRIVDAARRNMARRGGALRTAIEGTLESKRRAEEAREAAEQARLAAGAAVSQAESARTQLEKQKAEFHDWLAHVVHLRPGDAVRVRNFDRDGRVVKLRLDQQRAEIDIGAFAVEVPIGDLLPPEAAAPPPPPQRPQRLAAPPPRDGHRPRHDGRHREPAPHHGPRHETPRHDAPRHDGPRRHDYAGEGHGGPHERRREETRPEPALLPLSDARAAALKPGEVVFAKRFHRLGKVVRVKAAKQIVIVSVGAMELELPFSGLALPQPETPRKPEKKPRPAPAKGSGAPADRADGAELEASGAADPAGGATPVAPVVEVGVVGVEIATAAVAPANDAGTESSAASA